MRTLYFLFLIVLLSFSCKEQEIQSKSISGIWESIGSGWVLHIEDNANYTLYDITSISCIPNRKGPIDELLKNISLQEDTLSLLKGVITYKFIKTDLIPTLCTKKLQEDKQKDPIYNFEVFAETVTEHYAFMELNNIDWKFVYTQQRKKVTANTTPMELYYIIEETLEILNDNHAYLEATEELYKMIEQQSESEIEENSDKNNLPEYGDFQVAATVVKHHLKKEMTKDSWLIQWGELTNEIGYLQVKSMWLYADLDIPNALINEMGYVDAYVQTFHKMYEGDYINKEVLGVRKIMDRVMSDLSSMNSIVIDVRFNGGGQDAVSFEILNRFISKKTQIATQKLRFKDNFTSILPLYIQGSEAPYTGPIYVLTSPQTGSAAEAFAIASMALPKIKRLGAPTSGAMSTALEKTLPNGWTFSISNEIYMDNQGNYYENKGIPVDYLLDYPVDRQAFFRSVMFNLNRDKENILKAIEEVSLEKNL